MARFLHHGFAGIRRRIPLIVLAAGWIFGLICGWFLYVHADVSLISLMRGAIYSPVSIVGLVNVLAVPLLFSAIAVSISAYFLLPVLAWGKGMLFSFVSACALSAFGSGGWLAWPMLMFSDMAGVLILWMYLLQISTKGKVFPGYSSVFALILAGIADYCVISPFLAGL